jgi:hypothetical protein
MHIKMIPVETVINASRPSSSKTMPLSIQRRREGIKTVAVPGRIIIAFSNLAFMAI